MEIAYGTLEVLIRTGVRLSGLQREASGLAHVPAGGAAIVVTNHVSYLDPITVGLAVKDAGRWPRFLAKQELFAPRVQGALLRHLRQIPVDRTGHRGDAVSGADALLRDGELIVLFPEGTISETFVPAEPRHGAARLALATGAPIVPAALWGGHRVLTKYRPRRRARGVLTTTTFGPPLRPAGAEDAAALMARVWGEVRHLVAHAQRTYPQAPSGPDDTWWLPGVHRPGAGDDGAGGRG